MIKSKNIFFFFFIFISFFACQRSEKKEEFRVNIRMAQDIESLNPLSSSNFHAEKVIGLLFQGLLSVDYKNGKLVPLLAEDLPEIIKEDSVTFLHYRIRKEAKWDSVTSVTAEDVEFTLKMIKAPLINNEKKKLALEFIEDILLDSLDPKRFTFVCTNFIAERVINSGDFFILSKQLIDPEGYLEKASVKELHFNPEKYLSDTGIVKLAERYNSERFTRDPAYLRGSGPYEITTWKSSRYLKLKRKEKWWADEIKYTHIIANPNEIIFKIIPDNASALVALKNAEIDVYEEVPVEHFEFLKQDKNLQATFNFHTASSYYLYYLGINGRTPQLTDSLTRKAFLYLLDVPQIIKVVYKGNAIPTAGMVHPEKKTFYNDTLSGAELNISKCQNLLQQAGWKWNGTRWTRGNKELELTLQYKAGNNELENIGLIFKQAATQAGLAVQLVPVETSLLKQNLKNHQFDLYLTYFAGTPFSMNYKPILHTASAENGANYTGFGNKTTDSLIDAINVEVSEETKSELLKAFQVEFSNQGHIIPLFFSDNLLLINKKFNNANASSIKPGYDVKAFEMNTF